MTPPSAAAVPLITNAVSDELDPDAGQPRRLGVAAAAYM